MKIKQITHKKKQATAEHTAKRLQKERQSLRILTPSHEDGEWVKNRRA